MPKLAIILDYSHSAIGGKTPFTCPQHHSQALGHLTCQDAARSHTQLSAFRWHVPCLVQFKYFRPILCTPHIQTVVPQSLYTQTLTKFMRHRPALSRAFPQYFCNYKTTQLLQALSTNTLPIAKPAMIAERARQIKSLQIHLNHTQRSILLQHPWASAA